MTKAYKVSIAVAGFLLGLIIGLVVVADVVNVAQQILFLGAPNFGRRSIHPTDLGGDVRGQSGSRFKYKRSQINKNTFRTGCHDILSTVRFVNSQFVNSCFLNTSLSTLAHSRKLQGVQKSRPKAMGTENKAPVQIGPKTTTVNSIALYKRTSNYN